MESEISASLIPKDEGIEELIQLLDREVFSADSNQLNHLVADILVGDVSKEDYFKLVYLSVKSERFARIAANAITVLNYARVPFSGMDLSGIRIPRANLKGAILHETNLSDTDLTGIDLQNAFLLDVVFNKAQMRGIKLGKKFIKGPIEAEETCLSEDETILVIKGRVGHFVEIYFFELLTNKFLNALDSKPGFQTKIALCHSKKWLAFGSEDKTVEIWNLEDHKKPSILARLEGYSENVVSIIFNYEENYLATGCKNGEIKVWNITNISSPSLFASFKAYEDTVSALAFISSDHLASGSRSGIIKIWNLNNLSSKIILKSNEYSGPINCIIFNKINNQLAACGKLEGTKGCIFLWRYPALGSPMVLKSHIDEVISIAFSKNGKYLASGGKDGVVRLWEIMNEIGKSIFFQGHINTVRGVSFVKEEFLLSSGGDSIIRWWEIDEKNEKGMKEQNFSNFPLIITYLPSSSFIAASEGFNVRIWDIPNTLITLNGSDGLIARLACSLNGKYLAASEWHGFASSKLNNILVWNLKEREQSPKILESYTDTIAEIALSYDGTYLASTKGTELILRKLENDGVSETKTLSKHTDNVKWVLFNPYNRSFISCDHQTVYLWQLDMKSDEPTVLFTNKTEIVGISFNVDASLVLATADGMIFAWNALDNFNLLWQKSFSISIMGPISFSFSGGYMAFSNNNDRSETDKIQIWDLNQIKVVSTIEGHLSKIYGYCFNMEGDQLISSSEDHSIKVWGHDNKDRWLLKGSTRSLFFSKNCQIDKDTIISEENMELLNIKNSHM
jgi:WD40 repeat protein